VSDFEEDETVFYFLVLNVHVLCKDIFHCSILTILIYHQYCDIAISLLVSFILLFSFSFLSQSCNTKSTHPPSLLFQKLKHKLHFYKPIFRLDRYLCVIVLNTKNPKDNGNLC